MTHTSHLLPVILVALLAALLPACSRRAPSLSGPTEKTFVNVPNSDVAKLGTQAVVIVFVAAVLSGLAPVHAEDEWKQIDKKGMVSPLPPKFQPLFRSFRLVPHYEPPTHELTEVAQGGLKDLSIALEK